MAEDIQFTDLDSIRIAKPCRTSWNDMEKVDGNRVRHCCECNLNVYNLSAMSRREAIKLVEKHQGELCLRYYRRKDGTILTQDCPVGVAASERTLTGITFRALNWILTTLWTFIERYHAPVIMLGNPDWEEYLPPDLEDIWREREDARREEAREHFAVLTQEALIDLQARKGGLQLNASHWQSDTLVWFVVGQPPHGSDPNIYYYEKADTIYRREIDKYETGDGGLLHNKYIHCDRGSLFLSAVLLLTYGRLDVVAMCATIR